MKFTYLIRSLKSPNQIYTGIATNVSKRVNEHNEGKCPHTSKYRPWKLEVSICFQNDTRAVEFEKYLKSGSGRVFAKRHFW